MLIFLDVINPNGIVKCHKNTHLNVQTGVKIQSYR